MTSLKTLSISVLFVTTAAAQDSTTTAAKTSQLERDLAQLRADLDAERKQRQQSEQALLGELAKKSEPESSTGRGDRWYDRVTIGGYGEVNFNKELRGGHDQIDLRRFVAYLGYRFSDWIQLHSETEITHGLVGDDAGEVELEQLYVDFLLQDGVNIRAGRFLTPLGIVNKTHEPTTFNGVERGLFDTVVIPTTWSADGAGIFGRLSDRLQYELYVQSSLDGSGFDPVIGIREGRQETRAGLSEPAFSGRLDWRPEIATGQDLRVGVSAFTGGVDNGSEGINPGIDGDVQIYSGDFQYSVAQFDFRGVYAFEKIGGARDIGNNVASAIDGWQLEAAMHVMPDRWKTGKLEHSDLVAFARWDMADTQKDMPSGISADPRGKQSEWTVGLSFFPVENLVIKCDYQIRDDDSADGLPERFDVGIGWRF